MLMQLGNIQFTIAPMSMNEYDHEATATFAEHQVVGIRPPLEFMGPGPEQWTIKSKLFPKHFGGTLENMTSLQAMRTSGQSYFMMRGDGVPIGWVVITHIVERSSYIAPDGVGRVIDFDITVKLAEGPSPGNGISHVFALFS